MSRLRRLAGDDGGAREHLAAALALFGKLGMPFGAARAAAEG